MQKVVIFLIAITALVSLANAATLHVDDNKKEFPQAEYTDIQEAINAAKDGDVILVYLGDYSPFKVDKRVNLTGIDLPEIVASKDNNKIEIVTNGVTLRGFVTNATMMLNSSDNIVVENGIIGKNASIVINGINNTVAENLLMGNKYAMLIHSDNNTIVSNDIRGCNFGMSGREIGYNLISLNRFIGNNVSMVLYRSKDNVISNNTVFHSNVLGLNLLECSKNLVSENKFTNGTGWALRLAGGSENIIGGNIFENNTVRMVNDVPAGFHVFIMNSSSDVIIGNLIRGIIQNMVGIFAYNASDLIIKKVEAMNNVFGVYLWKCSNVAIDESYIVFNQNGTKIDESSKVTIYNSTFQNNDWGTIANASDVNIIKNTYVLNLHTINIEKSKAKIERNIILKNAFGVVLTNSNSCLIKNNAIVNTSDYALELLNSNKNAIYDNSIVGNKNGLKISGSGNEITGNVVGIKNGNYVLYITKPGNKIYFNDFLESKVFSSGGNQLYSPTKLTYKYNNKTFTNYLGNFWNDVTESMLTLLDPDKDGVLNKQKILGVDRDAYPLAKSIKNYEILG